MARIFGFAVAMGLLTAGLWMVHWAFPHRPLASFKRSVIYGQQLVYTRSGQPLGPPTFFTGERNIETGTGGADLVFMPLLITSAILFYQSVSGRHIRGSPIASVWLSAIVWLPIYGIVFVNFLYDAAGLKMQTHPAVVAALL